MFVEDLDGRLSGDQVRTTRFTAFEAEKMGDNVSLSAKLGWRF